MPQEQPTKEKAADVALDGAIKALMFTFGPANVRVIDRSKLSAQVRVFGFNQIVHQSRGRGETCTPALPACGHTQPGR